MITGLIWLLVALLIVPLAGYFWHEIPKNKWGNVEYLRTRRSKKVLTNANSPWFCALGPLVRLSLYTLLPQNEKCNPTFNAQNDVELAMTALLTYVSDPDVPDPQGGWPRYTWTAESPDEFHEHLNAYLEEKLISIGGQVDDDSFVDNIPTISLYLNCMVRLDGDSMPHLHHNSRTCRVDGCDLPREVDAEDLFRYYRTHWREAKRVLDREDKYPDKRSEVERRFGIDVLKVVLRSPRLADPEVRKARAAKEATERRVEGLRLRERKAQELINAGWPEDLAATFVENALDADVNKTNTRILQGGGDKKSPLIIRLDGK